MSDSVLALLPVAGVAEALLPGYVMGRRGHDAHRWTSLATFFGPLAVGAAIMERLRLPRRDARLIRSGGPGPGQVDDRPVDRLR